MSYKSTSFSLYPSYVFLAFEYFLLFPGVSREWPKFPESSSLYWRFTIKVPPNWRPSDRPFFVHFHYGLEWNRFVQKVGKFFSIFWHFLLEAGSKHIKPFGKNLFWVFRTFHLAKSCLNLTKNWFFAWGGNFY